MKLTVKLMDREFRFDRKSASNRTFSVMARGSGGFRWLCSCDGGSNRLDV